MKTRLSLTLLLPLFLLAGGCAAPPSPIDMTPLFVPNATRIEGVQSFVKLDARVKEFNGHLGISWRSKVTSVGPEGAEIEATIVRLVFQTPFGIGIDTASFLPLGKLGAMPGIGPLLYELIGKSFTYTVSPVGVVEVTEWSGAVARAANEVGVDEPKDGSIPTDGNIASTLSRAYAAIPHRVIVLGEANHCEVDFLECEGGPRIVGRDRLIYDGFGDEEYTFGGDDEEAEGLSLELAGTCDIFEGKNSYGIVQTGKSRRSGRLIVSEDGRELLYYRESQRTKIYPHTNDALLNEIKLATYETGWIFFAEPWDK